MVNTAELGAGVYVSKSIARFSRWCLGAVPFRIHKVTSISEVWKAALRTTTIPYSSRDMVAPPLTRFAGLFAHLSLPLHSAPDLMTTFGGIYHCPKLGRFCSRLIASSMCLLTMMCAAAV